MIIVITMSVIMKTIMTITMIPIITTSATVTKTIIT